MLVFHRSKMHLLRTIQNYSFLPTPLQPQCSKKRWLQYTAKLKTTCVLWSLSYNHIMFGIGTQELLLILLIILIFFGPKKLPELARGLGQAIKEVRQGLKDDHPKKTTKTEK